MTVDTNLRLGTFLIGNKHGAGLGSHFTFSAGDWLDGESVKGLVVGHGLGGEISCVQLHEMFLSPAQAWHLRHCPVSEDLKATPCPANHLLYRGQCFSVSNTARTLPGAEFDCSSDSLDTRLFYPEDFRALEYLSIRLRKQMEIAEVWIGIHQECYDSQP